MWDEVGGVGSGVDKRNFKKALENRKQRGSRVTWLTYNGMRSAIR